MSQVSSELEYQKTQISHPTYQLSRITQQSGGNNVTMSQTGGEQSLFELPATNAYNLAKSVLTFSALLSYSGGAAGTNYYFTEFNCLMPYIQQLSLYTRSGIFLADITDFQYYTNVIFASDTPLDELLTNDPQNLIYNNNTATLTNQRPNGNLTGGPPVTTVGRSDASQMVIEPSYYRTTPISTNAAAGPPVVIPSQTLNVQFRLSSIKNTIFALNKDLIFNEILVLRIIWGPVQGVGFATTAAYPGSVAGIASITGITLSNLNLYLAVEQNLSIVNALRARAQGNGFSVLIDYVHPFIYNTGVNSNSGTNAISYKFNRGHGMRLKRIYHAVYNYGVATNASLSIFAHFNNANGVSGNIVATYYTMLDNQRIQQFNVDCTTATDYLLNKHLLKGSPLESINVYQYNWFHVDSFDGMTLVEKNDNEEVGLDLSLEKKWDWFATLPATLVFPGAFPLNYHTYAITQKLLTVSNAGITVT